MHVSDTRVARRHKHPFAAFSPCTLASAALWFFVDLVSWDYQEVLHRLFVRCPFVLQENIVSLFVSLKHFMARLKRRKGYRSHIYEPDNPGVGASVCW